MSPSRGNAALPCGWTCLRRLVEEECMDRGRYLIADEMNAQRDLGLLAQPLTRRRLLRRVAAFGAAAPVVAGLLAACGSSSSNAPASSSAATSTSAGSQSTPAAAATTTAASTAQSAASSGSPAATPAQQGGETHYTLEAPKHTGGTIIWGATSDAKVANPILSTDTSSGAIIDMMFEGIMQTDPSTALPVGDLAKSWEISSDGITYSFVLQDGVKWHDGQPFTANDVKFTYDLMLNPATKSVRYSTLEERIKSIDVTDDTHFTVTLLKPNSAFLGTNMGYGIIPLHVLQNVKPADLASDPFTTGQKGRTIGTGPFMFEEWIKDDHVTEVKNPNYWRGAPDIDKWIYKVVPNQSVLTEQIKTGEVDYGGIQPSDVSSMMGQANVTVSIYDNFAFTNYMYQMDPAKTDIFQDKAVRQALLYALNRPAMVKAVYFGYARIAIGTMTYLSWAYNPDGITLKYPYDPDKAKSMLAAAGWKAGSDGVLAKNGKKLAFTLWTTSASQTDESLASIFQQEWKTIGVDCTVKTEEWNAFLNQINVEHDFDICLLGFSLGVDPDQS